MARINSCKKGKCGEREVAAMLTELTGMQFMRVPGSGMYQTRSKVQSLAGDVRPADDEMAQLWPYYVEVKNHRTVDFASMLWKRPSKQSLAGFWDVTEKAAEAAGKDPLLFFKTIGSPWFLLTDQDRAFSQVRPPCLTVKRRYGSTLCVFSPLTFQFRRVLRKEGSNHG